MEGARDAVRGSQEKLRAYTELLNQQARELDAEVRSVRLHPRYAVLVNEGTFGLPTVIDGPLEVERLDREIEQVRFALERLSSPGALDEVRGAIREYEAAERTRRAMATGLARMPGSRRRPRRHR